MSQTCIQPAGEQFCRNLWQDRKTMQTQLAAANANAETWRASADGWSDLALRLVSHCRHVIEDRDRLRRLLAERGIALPDPGPNHSGVHGPFAGPIAVSLTGEEP